MAKAAKLHQQALAANRGFWRAQPLAPPPSVYALSSVQTHRMHTTLRHCRTGTSVVISLRPYTHPLPPTCVRNPRLYVRREVLVRTNISFRDLSDKFLEMDDAEGRAYRSYKDSRAKFPKSVRIGKAFAAFLDEVMNKPLAARKLLLDVAKMDDDEGNGAEAEGGIGDGQARTALHLAERAAAGVTA